MKSFIQLFYSLSLKPPCMFMAEIEKDVVDNQSVGHEPSCLVANDYLFCSLTDSGI